jgi:hypothetical protein
MQALGKNGVLVLSSVTGGDRKVEVPADKINLEFVLRPESKLNIPAGCPVC